MSRRISLPWRSVVASATASIAACSPPPALLQRDGRLVVTDERVARAEVASARARLDSAMRDGDTPRLLALLDSAIVVVLPSGDSVVGRAAIASRLSARYDDVRAAATHVFPGPSVLCMGSLIETATDITLFVGHAQRADTISERVRTTWRDGGPGQWRLARAEFGRERADETPNRRECPRVSDVVFARRRLRLSATLPFSLQSLPQKVSAENQLRGEGYVIGPLLPTTANPASAFGSVDGNLEQSQGLVSLRGRIVGDWWADVVVGYGGTSFQTYGNNPLASSRVVAEFSSNVKAGVLLQREWHDFRLGIGAVAQQVDWHLIDNRHEQFPLEVPVDLRRAATTVGGVLEAGYTGNFGESFFFDVRLWQRVGGQTSLPSFGTVVGGGPVKLNATSLWLAVGFAL